MAIAIVAACHSSGRRFDSSIETLQRLEVGQTTPEEAEEIPAEVLTWLKEAKAPRLAATSVREPEPPSDDRRSAGDTCPLCTCGILRSWGETRIACENCDHMEQA